MERPRLVADLRRDYTRAGLSEQDLAPTWLEQFDRWFAQAADLTEPNAVVLATATPQGVPSARTVLLKAYDEREEELGSELMRALERYLLLQIIDGCRVALIIHAHGARDLDVFADSHGVRVAVGLFDLRSQMEILRRFSHSHLPPQVGAF